MVDTLYARILILMGTKSWKYALKAENMGKYALKAENMGKYALKSKNMLLYL